MCVVSHQICWLIGDVWCCVARSRSGWAHVRAIRAHGAPLVHQTLVHIFGVNTRKSIQRSTKLSSLSSHLDSCMTLVVAFGTRNSKNQLRYSLLGTIGLCGRWHASKHGNKTTERTPECTRPTVVRWTCTTQEKCHKDLSSRSE